MLQLCLSCVQKDKHPDIKTLEEFISSGKVNLKIGYESQSDYENRKVAEASFEERKTKK